MKPDNMVLLFSFKLMGVLYTLSTMETFFFEVLNESHIDTSFFNNF